MQHVKNAIGGNAMKMLKMHQNALKCTRMRMGKINTTFGKKNNYPHIHMNMLYDEETSRLHRQRTVTEVHPQPW